MSNYKHDLKCSKVIGHTGKECNRSPARRIELLNINLCEEHQEEFTKYIKHELGEA